MKDLVFSNEAEHSGTFSHGYPGIKGVPTSLLLFNSSLCDNTTARSLPDVIVQQPNKLYLSFDCVVGQCFDGASKMSGQYGSV